MSTLTTTPPAAPWDAEDALPAKPEGPEYGFASRGRVYACSREDLVAESANPARDLLIAWTPASPRFVTVWEIPFLEGSLRSRSLVWLRQRVQTAGLILFLLAGWAASNWASRAFPVFAAMAVFMGLLPLIWAVQTRREVNRGILKSEEMARVTRFKIWSRRRPGVGTWILAGALVLAGAWQLIVGLNRSAGFAGHSSILVTQGEPWRLLTAGLVHGGWIHFGLNFLALVTLARLAEAVSSRFHVITIFLVSMLAGFAARQVLDFQGISVGASGGILGILGFLAVFVVRRPRCLPVTIRNWILMMIFGVIVLGASAPGLIDNVGHAGGFFGGAILGWLMLGRSDPAIPARAGRAMRALGWGSTAVVAVTCLALPFTPKSSGLFESQILVAMVNAQKEPEQALRMANSAIELKPEHPMGYGSRGYIRHMIGDHAGAVADLTKALSIDPNMVAAYVSRSSARRELGDFKGALSDSDEALRREPDNWSAMEARLHALERSGAYDEALAGLDRAIGARSQDSGLRVWRAWVLVLLGRHDEALKECETALTLKPDDAFAFNTRGLAKAWKGDHEAALRDYSEAIRLEPEHPFAFSNRGDAKLSMGDRDGALEDFGTALKRDPEDPDALFGRGRVRHLKGDVPGARSDLAAALKAAPPGWHRRTEVEALFKELR